MCEGVARRVGVKTLFIESGSPWENGYVESFNRKLRDELLERGAFDTLLKARVLIERWRHGYNNDSATQCLGLPPRGQVNCAISLRWVYACSHGVFDMIQRSLFRNRVIFVPTRILARRLGGTSRGDQCFVPFFHWRTDSGGRAREILASVSETSPPTIRCKAAPAVRSLLLRSHGLCGRE